MKSKQHDDQLHDSQTASKPACIASNRRCKDMFKKLVKLKAMDWRYWITLVLIVFSLFYDGIWTAFQTAVCCFCTIATTKIPVARRTRNETATQTEVPEEHCTETRQEGNNSGEDETDSYVIINQESQPVTQYPHLKQALGKVFECAYSQFVLLWYDAPEPRERQVLHQALLQEFHTDVDHLIQTTRHLETMTLAVGVVHILTQHLQSSRLNEGKKQSQSRDEELALLRKCSEVLIRNLLPPSLWGLNYMQHLVTEVVSLKVLEPMISMLSDPDHLNQWMVGLFNDDQVPLLAVETVVAEAELNPPQEDERADEPQEPTMEETENPPEKKKKMRSKIADVFNKFKIKKSKKKKKKQISRKEGADPEPGNLSFRRLGDSQPSLSEADTEDLESDSVISYPETCFVFPYELWKDGHWKIMVSKVWEENEDLSFTIHIEERDDPFQWNVKKTLTAFQQLLSCLKEAPDFSSISDIVESRGQPADDEFLEKARLKLEDFLKELVLNHPAGQSEELFSFLQPPESLLESEEPLMEVWRLVRSVVSFFAPGETEEEYQDCSEDTVILDEIDGMDAASSSLGGGDLETDAVPIRDHLVEDAGESVPPQAAGVTDRGGAGSGGDEVCREDRTHSGDKPNPDQSNIAYRALLIGSADSECNPSDSEDSKMECCIEDSGSKASLPNGIPPCNSADVVDGKRLRGKTEKGKAKLNTRRQETKAEKPEKEVTKAIFELLKEITNNSFLVHCLKFIPSSYLAVKVLSKLHLDEKQVTACVEHLCEKLWPNGMPAEPSPERTSPEKKQTKERAEELLLKILSPYAVFISM
ncbi:uncharacterized protein LOC117430425 isoform X2 [Acipenser ruthenus]|uniref:uncharacterized protein LOC117430425 isoform X2 n=1 Tax=Acipenser ruthenus TaxID=7906 RepID=UPI002741C6E6|nr:uncharacterized protein LOC117430425 isoform X2 [Acipenser ruthenus]